MDVGIGVPSTIPGVSGPDVLEWARRADEAGFSSLGTLDRVVYGNFDPVPTLAACAAVTSRIRLITSILIAPYRGNGVLLGKQLASIDALSQGRLTVGIAVGRRFDDYAATETSFDDRGAVQDRLLAELDTVWSGKSSAEHGPVGPPPVQRGGPPLLIGGTGAAAVRRTVERASGWIAGGGGPGMFATAAEQVRSAWAQAGRPGSPRLAALGYFALGTDAESVARSYLLDYYAFVEEYAEQIAAGALTSATAIREDMARFAEAGCDELILFPCSTDASQVSKLADVVG